MEGNIYYTTKDGKYVATKQGVYKWTGEGFKTVIEAIEIDQS